MTHKSICYCTNLRRSANALSEYYDQGLESLDISASQFSLLNNLKRLGAANITKWAEMVGLERSTMVRNIKVLSTKGLIEITAGRGKTYTLTPKGNKTVAEANVIWQKLQKKIEEALGQKECQELLLLCEKVQKLKNT